MSGNDLKKFERDAGKAFEAISKEAPVSEVKVLSESVLGILIGNARGHGEVTYTSSGHEYLVAFGFAEIRLENGKLGVYNDLPEDLSLEDAETVSFLVTGLHKTGQAEIQFTKNKILLDRECLHKDLVDFQRAVLTKGLY